MNNLFKTLVLLSTFSFIKEVKAVRLRSLNTVVSEPISQEKVSPLAQQIIATFYKLQKDKEKCVVTPRQVRINRNEEDVNLIKFTTELEFNPEIGKDDHLTEVEQLHLHGQLIITALNNIKTKNQILISNDTKCAITPTHYNGETRLSIQCKTFVNEDNEVAIKLTTKRS